MCVCWGKGGWAKRGKVSIGAWRVVIGQGQPPPPQHRQETLGRAHVQGQAPGAQCTQRKRPGSLSGEGEGKSSSAFLRGTRTDRRGNLRGEGRVLSLATCPTWPSSYLCTAPIACGDGRSSSSLPWALVGPSTSQRENKRARKDGPSTHIRTPSPHPPPTQNQKPTRRPLCVRSFFRLLYSYALWKAWFTTGSRAWRCRGGHCPTPRLLSHSNP